MTRNAPDLGVFRRHGVDEEDRRVSFEATRNERESDSSRTVAVVTGRLTALTTQPMASDTFPDRAYKALLAAGCKGGRSAERSLLASVSVCLSKCSPPKS